MNIVRKGEQETLQRQAEDFASKIPDKSCSVAKLQDYLLRHRKDPQRAVDCLVDFMSDSGSYANDLGISKESGNQDSGAGIGEAETDMESSGAIATR